MPAPPAIQVAVWDAVSGEPFSSNVSALAVLAGRSYPLESVGHNVLLTYGGTGTSDLFVAKDGYHRWYTSGVRVTGSRCTTHTTFIRVEMTRSEPMVPSPIYSRRVSGSRLLVRRGAVMGRVVASPVAVYAHRKTRSL